MSHRETTYAHRHGMGDLEFPSTEIIADTACAASGLRLWQGCEVPPLVRARCGLRRSAHDRCCKHADPGKMSKEAETLIEQASALPPEDRIALVEDVLDRLDRAESPLGTRGERPPCGLSAR